MEFDFLENLDNETTDWYKLSPAERFEESQKLWKSGGVRNEDRRGRQFLMPCEKQNI